MASRPLKTKLLLLRCAVVLGLASGCSGVPGIETAKATLDQCKNYPGIADYQLPWNTATQYKVLETNCSNNLNRGVHRYGYDFAMPSGTSVIAARAGTVSAITKNAVDASEVGDNELQIQHSDGTVAHYGHLAKNGVIVTMGQFVAAGQAVAQSGQTGLMLQTALHFEVTQDDAGVIESIPIAFSNTSTSPLTVNALVP